MSAVRVCTWQRRPCARHWVAADSYLCGRQIRHWNAVVRSQYMVTAHRIYRIFARTVRVRHRTSSPADIIVSVCLYSFIASRFRRSSLCLSTGSCHLSTGSCLGKRPSILPSALAFFPCSPFVPLTVENFGPCTAASKSLLLVRSSSSMAARMLSYRLAIPASCSSLVFRLCSCHARTIVSCTSRSGMAFSRACFRSRSLAFRALASSP